MDVRSRDLLRAAQSGDVDAFAELFEVLRPMVYAVAIRSVGESDAEDVVMDTYLRAWKALPRFRRGAKLKTWLYRIARNCAVDVIRRRQRHPAESLSSREDGVAALRDVEDPDQERPGVGLDREERVGAVRAALEQLSADHRTALLLRFSDGLSYRELAAATGVSIGTVMSRLFNAKRRLRSIMESGEDDDA